MAYLINAASAAGTIFAFAGLTWIGLLVSLGVTLLLTFIAYKLLECFGFKITLLIRSVVYAVL